MLHFVTGNKHKIDFAKLVLTPLNIPFEVIPLPLVEIQPDSIEEIPINKAKQAFEQNLLRAKENKKVLFTEVICYIDNAETKVFRGEIIGRVLEEAMGKANHPFMELVTFRQDRRSMAQAVNEGLLEFDETTAWNEFGNWYKKL